MGVVSVNELVDMAKKIKMFASFLRWILKKHMIQLVRDFQIICLLGLTLRLNKDLGCAHVSFSGNLNVLVNDCLT